MWKLSSRRSKTEAAGAPSQAAAIAAASPAREVIYRHALAVRLTHWINALCLALLLMSGLQILNYHPALYWGNYGYRGVPSVASIGSEIDPASGAPVGVTRIAGARFVTTGVLGISYDAEHGMVRRAEHAGEYGPRCRTGRAAGEVDRPPGRDRGAGGR